MFGIGKMKMIPGTFGSLATIIILFILFHVVNISSNLILFGLVIIFIYSFSAVARHIENNCADQFEKPSLNEDGSVFADCAWHNISNIEIACDLKDNSSLDWGSRVKNKQNKE